MRTAGRATSVNPPGLNAVGVSQDTRNRVFLVNEPSGDIESSYLNDSKELLSIPQKAVNGSFFMNEEPSSKQSSGYLGHLMRNNLNQQSNTFYNPAPHQRSFYPNSTLGNVLSPTQSTT